MKFTLFFKKKGQEICLEGKENDYTCGWVLGEYFEFFFKDGTRTKVIQIDSLGCI